LLIAGDDDQALYAKKHAHPDFIRAIATDGSFEVFTLPYCSRCTEVIVTGVKRVIQRATNLHLLDGRLQKSFEPYPGKAEDSAAYPRIIHADCSIHRKDRPYMSRYVEQQIQRIPAADVELSYKEKHPTALVIGPPYFVSAVAEFLQQRGHQVDFRLSKPRPIDIADAYRLIAADAKSRLGWRIVHAVRPCDKVKAELALVIVGDGDLAAAFCAACNEDHSAHVALARRIFEGDQLSPGDEAMLRQRLEEDGDLRARLTGWSDEEPEREWDETRPLIVCASLIGSKGLSAEHVFVVGLNDGDFPRDPQAVTPTEVCELVVALSRTRKACHLVSCRRFGAQLRSPSTFLGWLGDAVESHWVDKAYWSE
jgi:hypothetical protein